MSIESCKEAFIRNYRNSIKRKGSEEFLDYLIESDFFEAPASTKYHLCESGGLCQHSLNVYWRLRHFLGMEYQDGDCPYNEETIAIVSLLHDVCKIYTYRKEYKKQRRQLDNGTFVWEDVPYYVYDEDFVYGHGEKSVYLIMKYMSITDVEAQAIRYHMGSFRDGEGRSYGDACENNPLVFFLHMADSAATFLDEG